LSYLIDKINLFYLLIVIPYDTYNCCKQFQFEFMQTYLKATTLGDQYEKSIHHHPKS
jgi:hypothetical protein